MLELQTIFIDDKDYSNDGELKMDKDEKIRILTEALRVCQSGFASTSVDHNNKPVEDPFLTRTFREGRAREALVQCGEMVDIE